MAVGVQALERRVADFHDGDAVSVHAVRQRAHVSGSGGPEAGVQERGQRFDAIGRGQRKVEPVRVLLAMAGSKPK